MDLKIWIFGLSYSKIDYLIGFVAQLVEQFTFNEERVGSNPTKLKWDRNEKELIVHLK